MLGGGISIDGERWVACRPGFFLPVRVLSRLFRRLFLERLLAAHQANRLKFFGDHAALVDTQAFAAYLAPLRRTEWVVYAKRPFGGPKAVLAYLSRYTHRVAIANNRLIACDRTGVTFYRAVSFTASISPGWVSTVMWHFLRLCERAKEIYTAERFADHVLPARIAGLVQYLADRETPTPLELGQKLLRILDLLIDMGDRRSAALQLGESFREIQIGAKNA
jgi:hypothetical protein